MLHLLLELDSQLELSSETSFAQFNNYDYCYLANDIAFENAVAASFELAHFNGMNRTITNVSLSAHLFTNKIASPMVQDVVFNEISFNNFRFIETTSGEFEMRNVKIVSTQENETLTNEIVNARISFCHIEIASFSIATTIIEDSAVLAISHTNISTVYSAVLLSGTKINIEKSLVYVELSGCNITQKSNSNFAELEYSASADCASTTLAINNALNCLLSAQNIQLLAQLNNSKNTFLYQSNIQALAGESVPQLLVVATEYIYLELANHWKFSVTSGNLLLPYLFITTTLANKNQVKTLEEDFYKLDECNYGFVLQNYTDIYGISSQFCVLSPYSLINGQQFATGLCTGCSTASPVYVVGQANNEPILQYDGEILCLDGYFGEYCENQQDGVGICIKCQVSQGYCTESATAINCITATCKPNFNKTSGCIACNFPHYMSGGSCVIDGIKQCGECRLVQGSCYVQESSGDFLCQGGLICQANFDIFTFCRQCSGGYVLEGGQCVQRQVAPPAYKQKIQPLYLSLAVVFGVLAVAVPALIAAFARRARGGARQKKQYPLLGVAEKQQGEPRNAAALIGSQPGVQATQLLSDTRLVLSGASAATPDGGKPGTQRLKSAKSGAERLSEGGKIALRDLEPRGQQNPQMQEDSEAGSGRSGTCSALLDDEELSRPLPKPPGGESAENVKNGEAVENISSEQRVLSFSRPRPAGQAGDQQPAADTATEKTAQEAGDNIPQDLPKPIRHAKSQKSSVNIREQSQADGNEYKEDNEFDDFMFFDAM